MVQTKAKGLATELLCQAYLTSLGYNISIPIGEDCRYDFILDINGSLQRIQVKSCQETENGITFSTKSITTSGNHNINHPYTKQEIDFISIYYNDQCYLIPVEEFEGKLSRSLSFTGKKVNETTPLFIEDFTAENIICKIQNNQKITKTRDDFIIYQYDLNNQLINTFKTYSEAGKSLNKTSSHISACARGLRKTAYGYIWRLTPLE